MASTLKHGSHEHPLQDMGTTEASVGAANCRACGLSLKSGGNAIGCRSCAFFLHGSCFLAPESLQYPLHEHQLVLRYTSANNEGFCCNICGKGEKGFNYHCKSCHFNAHLPCVKVPLKRRRPNHPRHELELRLRPPGGTSCRFCRKEIQHCYYSCSPCNVFVHVGCSHKRRKRRSFLGATAVVVGGICLVYKAIQIASCVFGIELPDCGMDGCMCDGSGENGVDFLQPGFDGYVDGGLEEEASSLAFEHMAMMDDI